MGSPSCHRGPTPVAGVPPSPCVPNCACVPRDSVWHPLADRGTSSHACQSLPTPFRWQTWESWHTWTKVVPCRTLVRPDKVFTLNKALIVRRVGTVCRPHRVSSGYWRRFVSRSVARSHEESAAVHTTRPSQKGIETYRSLACPGRTRSRGIGHLVPRGGGHCDPLRCGCSTTAASLSPKRSRRERRASSRSQSGAIMVNQVSGLSMSR